MAEELIKHIQLKDAEGNKVFPKTKGSIVINNKGEHLGDVEAGAQVNKLEKVQLNGADIAITNKVANIVLPAAAEYSLAKQETAETGMAATYFLTKDGVQVGEKINIAKDIFVKAGSVKYCEVEGEPLDTLVVGDAYIDLELQNSDEHLYIDAKDLVSEYIAGNGIVIDSHKVAIDTDVVATKEFVNGLPSVTSGITAEKVGAYDEHVADADIHVTTEDKEEWSGKQDALTEAQLAAVNSGITAEKLGALEDFAEGKQDTLSETQMAAVNSGMTAEVKASYDEHLADEDIHVTTEDKANWNGKLDESTYTTDKAALETRLGTIETNHSTLAAAVLYYDVISTETEEGI